MWLVPEDKRCVLLETRPDTIHTPETSMKKLLMIIPLLHITLHIPFFCVHITHFLFFSTTWLLAGLPVASTAAQLHQGHTFWQFRWHDFHLPLCVMSFSEMPPSCQGLACNSNFALFYQTFIGSPPVLSRYNRKMVLEFIGYSLRN